MIVESQFRLTLKLNVGTTLYQLVVDRRGSCGVLTHVCSCFDFNAVRQLHVERLLDICLWIGEHKIDLTSVSSKDKSVEEKDTTGEPGNDW